jgi:hypothetical protein
MLQRGVESQVAICLQSEHSGIDTLPQIKPALLRPLNSRSHSMSPCFVLRPLESVFMSRLHVCLMSIDFRTVWHT